MPPTIAGEAARLRRGETTSSELLEAALSRAAGGEGPRVFTRLYEDAARRAAREADARFAAGVPLSAIDGLPISIKDLFDVAGETTLAGSIALRDAPPATRDAVIVERLRRAGAVLVGKTNMTEFAYSGLGLNPHHGTPHTPWRRDERRIAGGSSSGAAVSVTDGMSVAAIGTDTGGSVRVPAAFCGLVGFKPTAARVPRQGTFELSATLDSIGPLGNSVACCTTLDAILADAPPLAESVVEGRTRIGVASGYLVENCDPIVERAFAQALRAVERSGAKLVELPRAQFDLAEQLVRTGSFSAVEAWDRYGKSFAAMYDLMDPMVRTRFASGRDVTAAAIAEMRRLRAALIETVAAICGDVDAIALPAVPILPPREADLAAEPDFLRANTLSLRNTALANFCDGCSITLPCAAEQGAPVGFMLVGARHMDARILALAARFEAALS